jgi:phosphohistidine phosphatase
MKTLLLLRHAKSSWKDSDLDDHDRPLNQRGRREAPRMGRLLLDENLVPDLIVASSARRARKTAEEVIRACGYRGDTRFTGELYSANRDRLRTFLGTLPAAADRVLLIGHNPALEELAESLLGAYCPLSTAALAHLKLAISAWDEISGQPAAELIRVWQPGELE